MSIIIQHQKQRLQDIKGQLAYVQHALKQKLEAWERQEYAFLEADYTNQINELTRIIAPLQ